MSSVTGEGGGDREQRNIVGELASVCFDDIESGLLILDKDLNIVMWNAWMTKASRVSRKQALGKCLDEVFPELKDTRVWKAIGSSLKHGMPSLLSHTLNKAQFPLYRPFRQTKELMRQIIVIKPTRIPGVERHCMVQISDVTPAVIREEMLRKQAHELKLAQSMLLDAEREAAKVAVQLEREETEAQMAGGFAHEMRNALAGPNMMLMGTLGQERKDVEGKSAPQRIREALMNLHAAVKDEGISSGAMETFMDGLKTINRHAKSIDQVMHSVQESTERALTITKQIMQYSKLGHSAKGTEKVDIAALIRTIVDEGEDDFHENNIRIHVEAPQVAMMTGDEVQYYSIFKNLINNARDALVERYEGSSGAEIGVVVEPHQTRWKVAISDNGVGIKPESIKKIFSAFFSTKPETGTGLGLGMVKKLVSLYDGDISVESDVGVGTTFTLTFWDSKRVAESTPDEGVEASVSEDEEHSSEGAA